MAPAGDPIGTGLIGSLARPGGNITGVSGTSAELSAKCLELIREIVPKARRVAVVGNASDPFSKPFLEEIQKRRRRMGLEIQPLMISGNGELAGAFAAMIRERADAVIVQGNIPIQSSVDLALKNHLPAFSSKKIVDAGGSAWSSYSASLAERAARSRGYVDKILKGATPAELPVQQPTTFDLDDQPQDRQGTRPHRPAEPCSPAPTR